MDDFTIEILDSDEMSEDKNSEIQLPVNFVSVGTVSQDSIKVYIKQDVYKRIEKFAKEEMSKEVGSILIGNYTDNEDEKSVVVSDYIEAKYTDSTASTLTFTHDTWEYVYKEKDKKFPDKKIVGWQHTHPGYGIFLSNYDVFIQENFFNLPWQIAYVVDPIADTRGFFEWKDGKISKMSGFYIYDEEGREILISEKAKPPKKKVSASSVILSLLLIIFIMFSVFATIENINMSSKLNEAMDIIEQHREQPVPIVDEKPDNIESFNVYIVQEGDYLEGICAKFNLDYNENIQKIVKINGITDVNKIYAEQKLYLPIR